MCNILVREPEGKKPLEKRRHGWEDSTEMDVREIMYLTHCGRVMQICVFNTVKLGTSASSL